jgi:hypothetical protein
MHPAEMTIEALLNDCDIRFSRRSGPGGQHRNKVETAVILLHRPTGISAEACERRSQIENRRVATTRLRLKLALLKRSQRDTKTVPSTLWDRRCQNGRIRVSPEHTDFAALLAEALDVVDAHQYDVKGASEQLHVTTTQLVRFLKSDPRGLEEVNRQRLAVGLSRLH